MPLERLANPLHKDCSHIDFPGQEVWKIDTIKESKIIINHNILILVVLIYY